MCAAVQRLAAVLSGSLHEAPWGLPSIGSSAAVPPGSPHRAQPLAVPGAGQVIPCCCAFCSESPSHRSSASTATGHWEFGSRTALWAPRVCGAHLCVRSACGTPGTAAAQGKVVVDLPVCLSGTADCKLPEARGCDITTVPPPLLCFGV